MTTLKVARRAVPLSSPDVGSVFLRKLDVTAFLPLSHTAYQMPDLLDHRFIPEGDGPGRQNKERAAWVQIFKVHSK